MDSILYVDCNDFSKEHFGSGGATVNAAAIRHLNDIFLFVGYSNKEDSPKKIISKQQYGVKLHLLPLSSYENAGSRRIPGAFKLMYYLWKNRRILHQQKSRKVFTRNYAALWYFSFFTDFEVCYYAPGLGNPWVIGRHPFLGKYLARLYEWIQCRALKKVRYAWGAASLEETDYWNDLLRRHHVETRIESVPTAADTDFFRPMDQMECRKQWNLPPEVPVFCFTGRLAKVKGVELLLESFRLVIESFPEARLILAGDGEERNALEELARRLRIDDRVLFTGRRPPREIVTLLNSADVCVVGSHTEGFSLSMVEQVACGKPIVTTPVSGSELLVFENRNGFIVPDRNPKSFSQKMIDALNLPDAAKVSRGIAEEKFSEKMMWSRIRKRLAAW